MNNQINTETNLHECVRCEVCGMDLGEHRPLFAQEHLRKFPTHRKYAVISKKRSST
jgi:hypothetical protein